MEVAGMGGGIQTRTEPDSDLGSKMLGGGGVNSGKLSEFDVLSNRLEGSGIAVRNSRSETNLFSLYQFACHVWKCFSHP